MRFEGVIFDAGDILYDASVWRRWLTEELRRRRVDITYPQLVQRWEALLVDVYCGRAAYWDRFNRLLSEIGLPSEEHDLLTAAAREKGKTVQVDRQPFEGVPETLEVLRTSGVKLAILSDTESTSEKVRDGLDRLGVADYFDAIVTSLDVGHAKPEPEAFQAAASALGTNVRRCAFVAHDIDELEGAQAIGLYAIAYNYDPEAPADEYIEHFTQLKSIVLR